MITPLYNHIEGHVTCTCNRFHSVLEKTIKGDCLHALHHSVISATIMDSVDVAVEFYRSEIEENSFSEFNYGSEYQIQDATEGVKTTLKGVFRDIMPAVLRTHKHIRVFLSHHRGNWTTELPELCVPENYLNQLRTLTLESCGLKCCVSVQSANGKNSSYLIPAEIENYISFILTDEGYITEESAKYLNVMVMFKKPIDDGDDEVEC